MADFIENILAYVFFAIFAIFFIYGIYSAIRIRYQPYHKYIRRIKIKQKSAAFKELQELRLEKKWIEYIGKKHFSSYVFWNLDKTEMQLEAAKNGVLAKITSTELELPNAHKSLPNEAKYFFRLIISETINFIKESEYSKSAFFPEGLLPYPKEYILFAVDSLSGDIHYSSPNTEYLREVLTDCAIDIHPNLLPIELKENERIGLRIKNSR